MGIEQITIGYGSAALFTAFFIALIGDNKGAGLDLFRIALWPLFWATVLGQVVRGFIRMFRP